MSLASLLKKGSLRRFATATVATPATDQAFTLSSVATVATVAVATAPDRAANDRAAPELQLQPCPVTDPEKQAGVVNPDPDRWCWPHSEAMTGSEITTFTTRLHVFTRRGLVAVDAETLADKLVLRDREADDRRVCLECSNLSRGSGWRCTQWQRAGLGAAGVPADLARQLQRCDGFSESTPQRTTP
jgi:hypothetical protein